MENETKSGGVGGGVAVIIIIIIIIAGGWYFIGNRVEKISDQKQQAESAKVIDVSTGTSTEVADIQKDLDNLDLNTLNQ